MNDYDPTTTAIDLLEAEYDAYYEGCLAEGLLPLPLPAYHAAFQELDFACETTNPSVGYCRLHSMPF